MIVKDNKTLTAENVEVDMETLAKATSVSAHPLTKRIAHYEIVEAVIKALDPKDREKLKAYNYRMWEGK